MHADVAGLMGAWWLRQRTIIQSAAAIGTTDNVERSTDILGVLMMQNGTQMTDENGMASVSIRLPDNLTTWRMDDLLRGRTGSDARTFR